MKTVKEIISEIRSGVPEESYGEQVRYLQSKMKEFANHPYFPAVEAECNQLIYTLMPKEKKDAIRGRIASEIQNVKEQLEKAEEFILRGDYSSAYQISMPLSELADRRPVIEDDGVSAFFTFTEDFEKVIYLENERQKGRNTAERLKETEFPYYGIYTINGTCLIETGKYREAAEEFVKASYWNPASAYARFQYLIALLKMGVDRNNRRLCLDNMKYLFCKKDFAECYHHLALIYDADGHSEATIACLMLSLSYCPDQVREEYLNETLKDMNMLPSQFTTERIKELAAEYRFPLHPEETAVKLAYENGVSMIDSNPKQALYYLRIANDLSDDVEIKEKLALVEKKMGSDEQKEENPDPR